MRYLKFKKEVFFLIMLFSIGTCLAGKVGEYHFPASMVKQVLGIERGSVIARANDMLKLSPRTVTSDFCPRSKGGKHDFFSEGPYWWPDPANPAGPYVRRDGERNPDLFQAHDNDLGKFSWIVGTQTSAYLLTGKEIYAKTAMRQMKAWFVDTLTRMNPNMNYAQAIQGICTGRGIGIIDAVPLIEVAQSAMILEKSPYVSGKDMTGIKEWFNQFLMWLTTHPYGIDEMNTKNNHATWWHAQVSVYARLVGNQEALQLCRKYYKETFLKEQMAANGSFPLELERTKPYSYSLFNLDASALMAWCLSDQSFDVWKYALPDGRGIRKGLDFIKPYLKNKTEWPYEKDISNWKDQPGARPFMLFAALADQNQEWFTLWKNLSAKPGFDRNRLSAPLKNPVLWLGLTPKNK